MRAHHLCVCGGGGGGLGGRSEPFSTELLHSNSIDINWSFLLVESALNDNNDKRRMCGVAWYSCLFGSENTNI